MQQLAETQARFSFLKTAKVIISFSIIFVSLHLAGARVCGQNPENLPGIDPTFAPKISKGGSVAKTILQPDGKIVLIGTFTEAGGFQKTNIVRLNADNSVDNSFNLQSDINPMTLEILPDGKFIGYGKTLVRFNQDGSIDPSFNFARELWNVNGDVKLKPRSDGKVFLWGDFRVKKRNLVFAEDFILVDQLGGVESGFQQDINIAVADVVPLANGKTIIAGKFELRKAGQVINRNFAVLDENGSPDLNFAGFYGTPAQSVNGAIAQPDGKLVLYGNFSEVHRQLQTGKAVKNKGLLRLNADGSFDRDFNVPFAQGSNLSGAHLQPDGKIVINGQINAGDGNIYRSPARVFPDGSFDATYSNNLPFVAGFIQTLGKLEMQPDGRLLMAGKFKVANRPEQQKIIKLNADGTLDQTFETPTITGGDVFRFNVLPDGNIFIAGFFAKIGNRTRVGAARLNPGGSLDENFRFDILNDEFVEVMTLNAQPDGKFIISGEFSVINGEYIQNHPPGAFGNFREHTFNAVVRLNIDGSLDNSFLSLTNLFEKIYRIVVQPDGKILIGGVIYGSLFENYVVRLNADGSLDTSFTRLRIVGPPGNGNSAIYDIAVQPDEKIIIVGYFGYVNAVIRHKIARLNADGTLDYSFEYPNFEYDLDKPQIIALQSDGKIIVGGNPINGFRSPGLPRFNRNGTLDAGFSWNRILWVPANTLDMELLPDGKLLYSGQIGGYGYEVFHPFGLARLNQSGEIEFRYNVKAEKFLRQADGKIVLLNSAYPAPGFTLTRIFAGGGADDTFSFTLDGRVKELIRQPDGKIVLAGRFTTVSGVRRFHMARLNP